MHGTKKRFRVLALLLAFLMVATTVVPQTATVSYAAGIEDNTEVSNGDESDVVTAGDNENSDDVKAEGISAPENKDEGASSSPDEGDEQEDPEDGEIVSEAIVDESPDTDDAEGTGDKAEEPASFESGLTRDAGGDLTPQTTPDEGYGYTYVLDSASGNDEHKTLSALLTAIGDDTTIQNAKVKIKLASNITEAGVISLSAYKDLTIDLCGRVWTLAGDDSNSALTVSGGKVTIIDSGREVSSSVEKGSVTSAAINTINVTAGKVILGTNNEDGPSIKNTNTGTVQVKTVLVNGATAELEMNSGEITVGAYRSEDSKSCMALRVEAGASADLKGGTIKGGQIGMICSGAGSTVTLEGATVIINAISDDDPIVDGTPAATTKRGVGVQVRVGASVTMKEGSSILFTPAEDTHYAAVGVVVLTQESETTSFTMDGGDIAISNTTYTMPSFTGVQVGSNTDGKTAQFIMNGGNITATWHGITGNGSQPYTKIDVKGGTITAHRPGYTMGLNGSAGIFSPEKSSVVTIGKDDGTGPIIEGDSGIVKRNGSLVVKGGSIIGTTTDFYARPASGSEPDRAGAGVFGAGIAIEKHSEKDNLGVTISGGTITGSHYGIYELKNENEFDDGTSVGKGTLAISKGFIEATKSDGKAIKLNTQLDEDKFKVTITGGEFADGTGVADGSVKPYVGGADIFKTTETIDGVEKDVWTFGHKITISNTSDEVEKGITYDSTKVGAATSGYAIQQVDANKSYTIVFDASKPAVAREAILGFVKNTNALYDSLTYTLDWNDSTADAKEKAYTDLTEAIPNTVDSFAHLDGVKIAGGARTDDKFKINVSFPSALELYSEKYDGTIPVYAGSDFTENSSAEIKVSLGTIGSTSADEALLNKVENGEGAFIFSLKEIDNTKAPEALRASASGTVAASAQAGLMKIEKNDETDLVPSDTYTTNAAQALTAKSNNSVSLKPQGKGSGLVYVTVKYVPINGGALDEAPNADDSSIKYSATTSFLVYVGESEDNNYKFVVTDESDNPISRLDLKEYGIVDGTSKKDEKGLTGYTKNVRVYVYKGTQKMTAAKILEDFGTSGSGKDAVSNFSFDAAIGNATSDFTGQNWGKIASGGVDQQSATAKTLTDIKLDVKTAKTDSVACVYEDYATLTISLNAAGLSKTENGTLNLKVKTGDNKDRLANNTATELSFKEYVPVELQIAAVDSSKAKLVNSTSETYKNNIVWFEEGSDLYEDVAVKLVKSADTYYSTAVGSGNAESGFKVSGFKIAAENTASNVTSTRKAVKIEKSAGATVVYTFGDAITEKSVGNEGVLKTLSAEQMVILNPTFSRANPPKLTKSGVKLALNATGEGAKVINENTSYALTKIGDGSGAENTANKMTLVVPHTALATGDTIKLYTNLNKWVNSASVATKTEITSSSNTTAWTATATTNAAKTETTFVITAARKTNVKAATSESQTEDGLTGFWVEIAAAEGNTEDDLASRTFKIKVDNYQKWVVTLGTPGTGATKVTTDPEGQAVTDDYFKFYANDGMAAAAFLSYFGITDAADTHFADYYTLTKYYAFSKWQTGGSDWADDAKITTNLTIVPTFTKTGKVTVSYVLDTPLEDAYLTDGGKLEVHAYAYDASSANPVDYDELTLAAGTVKVANDPKFVNLPASNSNWIPVFYRADLDADGDLQIDSTTGLYKVKGTTEGTHKYVNIGGNDEHKIRTADITEDTVFVVRLQTNITYKGSLALSGSAPSIKTIEYGQKLGDVSGSLPSFSVDTARAKGFGTTPDGWYYRSENIATVPAATATSAVFDTKASADTIVDETIVPAAQTDDQEGLILKPRFKFNISLKLDPTSSVTAEDYTKEKTTVSAPVFTSDAAGTTSITTSKADVVESVLAIDDYQGSKWLTSYTPAIHQQLLAQVNSPVKKTVVSGPEGSETSTTTTYKPVLYLRDTTGDNTTALDKGDTTKKLSATNTTDVVSGNTSTIYVAYVAADSVKEYKLGVATNASGRELTWKPDDISDTVTVEVNVKEGTKAAESGTVIFSTKDNDKITVSPVSLGAVTNGSAKVEIGLAGGRWDSSSATVTAAIGDSYTTFPVFVRNQYKITIASDSTATTLANGTVVGHDFSGSAGGDLVAYYDELDADGDPVFIADVIEQLNNEYATVVKLANPTAKEFAGFVTSGAGSSSINYYYNNGLRVDVAAGSDINDFEILEGGAYEGAFLSGNMKFVGTVVDKQVEVEYKWLPSSGLKDGDVLENGADGLELPAATTLNKVLYEGSTPATTTATLPTAYELGAVPEGGSQWRPVYYVETLSSSSASAKTMTKLGGSTGNLSTATAADNSPMGSKVFQVKTTIYVTFETDVTLCEWDKGSSNYVEDANGSFTTGSRTIAVEYGKTVSETYAALNAGAAQTAYQTAYDGTTGTVAEKTKAGNAAKAAKLIPADNSGDYTFAYWAIGEATTINGLDAVVFSPFQNQDGSETAITESNLTLTQRWYMPVKLGVENPAHPEYAYHGTYTKELADEYSADRTSATTIALGREKDHSNKNLAVDILLGDTNEEIIEKLNAKRSFWLEDPELTGYAVGDFFGWATDTANTTIDYDPDTDEPIGWDGTSGTDGIPWDETAPTSLGSSGTVYAVWDLRSVEYTVQLEHNDAWKTGEEAAIQANEAGTIKTDYRTPAYVGSDENLIWVNKADYREGTYLSTIFAVAAGYIDVDSSDMMITGFKDKATGTVYSLGSYEELSGDMILIPQFGSKWVTVSFNSGKGVYAAKNFAQIDGITLDASALTGNETSGYVGSVTARLDASNWANDPSGVALTNALIGTSGLAATSRLKAPAVNTAMPGDSKPEYSFYAWSYQDNDGVTQYITNNGGYSMIRGDLLDLQTKTFTAVYKPNKVRVQVVTDGKGEWASNSLSGWTYTSSSATETSYKGVFWKDITLTEDSSKNPEKAYGNVEGLAEVKTNLKDSGYAPLEVTSWSYDKKGGARTFTSSGRYVDSKLKVLVEDGSLTLITITPAFKETQKTVTFSLGKLAEDADDFTNTAYGKENAAAIRNEIKSQAVFKGRYATQPNITKIGAWTLKGWYTKGNLTAEDFAKTDGTAPVAWDFSKNAITDSVDLYAYWTTDVSVSLQGPTAASIGDNLNAAEVAKLSKVLYGQKITTTQISKLTSIDSSVFDSTKYAEDGWYSSLNGGADSKVAADIPLDLTSVKDTEAKLTKKYFTYMTLKLDTTNDGEWKAGTTNENPGGGTNTTGLTGNVETRNFKVLLGDAASLTSALSTVVSSFPSKATIKEGRTFTNWTTDGTTAIVPGTTVITSAGQTLTAKFAASADIVTITMNIGGLYTDPATVFADGGSAATRDVIISKADNATIGSVYDKLAALVNADVADTAYGLTGFTYKNSSTNKNVAFTASSTDAFESIAAQNAATEKWTLAVTAVYGRTKLTVDLDYTANGAFTALGKKRLEGAPAATSGNGKKIFIPLDRNADGSVATTATLKPSDMAVYDTYFAEVSKGKFVDKTYWLIGGTAAANRVSRGDNVVMTTANASISPEYVDATVQVDVYDNDGNLVASNKNQTGKDLTIPYYKTATLGLENAKVAAGATTADIWGENVGNSKGATVMTDSFLRIKTTVTPSVATGYVKSVVSASDQLKIDGTAGDAGKIKMEAAEGGMALKATNTDPGYVRISVTSTFSKPADLYDTTTTAAEYYTNKSIGTYNVVKTRKPTAIKQFVNLILSTKAQARQDLDNLGITAGGVVQPMVVVIDDYYGKVAPMPGTDKASAITTLAQLSFHPVYQKNAVTDTNVKQGFQDGAGIASLQYANVANARPTGVLSWSTAAGAGSNAAKNIKLAQYKDSVTTIDVDIDYTDENGTETITVPVNFVTVHYSLTPANPAVDHILATDEVGVAYTLKASYVGPKNVVDELNSTTAVSSWPQINSVYNEILNDGLGAGKWEIVQSPVSKGLNFFNYGQPVYTAGTKANDGFTTFTFKPNAAAFSGLNKKTAVKLTARYNGSRFTAVSALNAVSNYASISLGTGAAVPDAAVDSVKTSLGGSTMTDVVTLNRGSDSWTGTLALDGYEGKVYQVTDIVTNLKTIHITGTIWNGQNMAKMPVLKVASDNSGVAKPVSIQNKLTGKNATYSISVPTDSEPGNSDTDYTFEAELTVGKPGQAIVTISNSDDYASSLKLVVNALSQDLTTYQLVGENGTEVATTKLNATIGQNEKNVSLLIKPDVTTAAHYGNVKFDLSTEPVIQVTGKENPFKDKPVINAGADGAIEIDWTLADTLKAGNYNIKITPSAFYGAGKTMADMSQYAKKPVAVTLVVKNAPAKPTAKVTAKANIALKTPVNVISVKGSEEIDYIEIKENSILKGKNLPLTDNDGNPVVYALAKNDKATRHSDGKLGDMRWTLDNNNGFSSANQEILLDLYTENSDLMNNVDATAQDYAQKMTLVVKYKNFNTLYELPLSLSYESVQPTVKLSSNSVTLFAGLGFNSASFKATLDASKTGVIAPRANAKLTMSKASVTKVNGVSKNAAEWLELMSPENVSGTDVSFTQTPGNLTTVGDGAFTVRVLDSALTSIRSAGANAAFSNAVVYSDDVYRGVKLPLKVSVDTKTKNLSWGKLETASLNTTVEGKSDVSYIDLPLTGGAMAESVKLSITPKSMPKGGSTAEAGSGSNAAVEYEADVNNVNGGYYVVPRVKFSFGDAAPVVGKYVYNVSASFTCGNTTYTMPKTASITLNVVSTAINDSITLTRTGTLDVYDRNDAVIIVTPKWTNIGNGAKIVNNTVEFLDSSLDNSFAIENKATTEADGFIRIRIQNNATDLRTKKSYEMYLKFNLETASGKIIAVTPNTKKGGQTALKGIKLKQSATKFSLFATGAKKAATSYVISGADNKANVAAVEIYVNSLRDKVTYTGLNVFTGNASTNHRYSEAICDSSRFGVTMDNANGKITVEQKKTLPKGNYQIRFYLYPVNCANDTAATVIQYKIQVK